MKNDVIKFFANVVAFAIPFIILILLFFVFDPFKIARHYDNYYDNNAVILNRDLVSVETFLANSKKITYDSFIMGNSRSLAFLCSDWSPYLNNGTPFHFDAHGESIFGIYKKLKFLVDRKVRIKHLLFTIDYTTLRLSKNSPGHLFIKHPLISGESRIAFDFEFFRAFISKGFIIKYFDHIVSGEIKPYMAKVIEKRTWEYMPLSNDIIFDGWERSISHDPAGYFGNIRDHLAAYLHTIRHSTDPVINAQEKKMLEDIHAILVRQGTEYKIVINPDLDKIPTNPNDLLILRSIFGENNVFDYSGDNEFTRDFSEYYDVASHYRPILAKKMMEDIYHARH